MKLLFGGFFWFRYGGLGNKREAKRAIQRPRIRANAAAQPAGLGNLIAILEQQLNCTPSAASRRRENVALSSILSLCSNGVVKPVGFELQREHRSW
jgi:hypothetical protein